MFRLQVIAQQHWHSGYKLLIDDFSDERVKCHMRESSLKVDSRKEIPSVKLSVLDFWSDALPIIQHYGLHSIVILLHLIALELGADFYLCLCKQVAYSYHQMNVAFMHGVFQVTLLT